METGVVLETKCYALQAHILVYVTKYVAESAESPLPGSQTDLLAPQVKTNIKRLEDQCNLEDSPIYRGNPSRTRVEGIKSVT